MLMQIVAGKKLPEQQIYDTGIDVVTRANVSQFLAAAAAPQPSRP